MMLLFTLYFDFEDKKEKGNIHENKCMALYLLCYSSA